MLKVINTLVIFTLIIFAFFAGVKYSDSIKEHAGWLFEIKEEELTDLPIEDSDNIGAIIDETTGNEEIIEPNYSEENYQNQSDSE